MVLVKVTKLCRPLPLAKTKQNIPFSHGLDEKVALENLELSITEMIKPLHSLTHKKAIMVRVEASFHEGLLAGLFQKIAKNIQPVNCLAYNQSIR